LRHPRQWTLADPSRLDEAICEFVCRYFHIEISLIARVGRIAKKVAFLFKSEASFLKLIQNDSLVNAMERLCRCDVSARLGGVVDHDEVSARLQRFE
jgi:hypothetical protein